MRKKTLFQRLMNLLLLAQFSVTDGDNGGGNDGDQGDGGNAGGQEGSNNAGGQEGSQGQGGQEGGQGQGKNKDGISDGEAKLLKEIMDKKSALKERESKISQLEAALAKFNGIDLDEVSKMLADKKKAEEQQLEQKGEWDRLKANLVDEHGKEKSALQARIAELEGQLSEKDGSINRLTIGSAFSASNYIAEELTLTPAKAQIIYGSHFDFEGDKIVGYDKPRGAANRTTLIGADGEPLAFDKAMAKLIEIDPDKERLVKTKMKPGANSASITEGVKTPQPEATGRDRIAAALGS